MLILVVSCSLYNVLYKAYYAFKVINLLKKLKGYKTF